MCDAQLTRRPSSAYARMRRTGRSRNRHVLGIGVVVLITGVAVVGAVGGVVAIVAAAISSVFASVAILARVVAVIRWLLGCGVAVLWVWLGGNIPFVFILLGLLVFIPLRAIRRAIIRTSIVVCVVLVFRGILLGVIALFVLDLLLVVALLRSLLIVTLHCRAHAHCIRRPACHSDDLLLNTFNRAIAIHTNLIASDANGVHPHRGVCSAVAL